MGDFYQLGLNLIRNALENGFRSKCVLVTRPELRIRIKQLSGVDIVRNSLLLIGVDIDDGLAIKLIDLVAGVGKVVIDFGFSELLVNNIILPVAGFDVVGKEVPPIVFDHYA